MNAGGTTVAPSSSTRAVSPQVRGVSSDPATDSTDVPDAAVIVRLSRRDCLRAAQALAAGLDEFSTVPAESHEALTALFTTLLRAGGAQPGATLPRSRTIELAIAALPDTPEHFPSPLPTTCAAPGLICDPIDSRTAAAMLGRSRQWVGFLAQQGTLLGVREGRTWVLDRADVERYRDRRPQVSA